MQRQLRCPYCLEPAAAVHPARQPRRRRLLRQRPRQLRAPDSDQEAADKVAKLIDDIYVQERTDDTDEQCKAAKEAWDALTDEQKELVEGENADPDYFGT